MNDDDGRIHDDRDDPLDDIRPGPLDEHLEAAVVDGLEAITGGPLPSPAPSWYEAEFWSEYRVPHAWEGDSPRYTTAARARQKAEHLASLHLARARVVRVTAEVVEEVPAPDGEGGDDGDGGPAEGGGGP